MSTAAFRRVRVVKKRDHLSKSSVLFFFKGKEYIKKKKKQRRNKTD